MTCTDSTGYPFDSSHVCRSASVTVNDKLPTNSLDMFPLASTNNVPVAEARHEHSYWRILGAMLPAVVAAYAIRNRGSAAFSRGYSLSPFCGSEYPSHTVFLQSAFVLYDSPNSCAARLRS